MLCVARDSARKLTHFLTGILVTEGWDPTFKERFYSIHSELKAEMKQMINNNLSVINQDEEIQASELERIRKRKQKQAAKVALEKENELGLEFDREFDAKYCNLYSIFLYDGIFKFDCKERYFEALYETRCGYYEREEEIKNDMIFKKRVKQKFMEIKEYSEMEVWNPNTGRRHIYDEDDLYGDPYDELWNIEEGVELYYQRYQHEHRQHILQSEQLRKQEREEEPQSQEYVQLQKEMIQKRKAVQETMFQHFKGHTSEYKESDEKQ